jgi:hypothetical protein
MYIYKVVFASRAFSDENLIHSLIIRKCIGAMLFFFFVKFPTLILEIPALILEFPTLILKFSTLNLEIPILMLDFPSRMLEFPD